MYRHISLASLVSATIGSIAVAAPYNTNLLANPSATAGLADWNFVHAGNGWAISGESQDGDDASFITSWRAESMSQTVDLLAAGFSAAELDASPAINVAGYTKSTQWHSDYARATYQLQDGSGTVLASYNTGWMSDIPFTWTPLSWQASLPVGTRKVSVTYEGYDGEVWIGYYGVAFDAASVTIAPEPASLAMLSLVAVGLVRRSRDKRNS